MRPHQRCNLVEVQDVSVFLKAHINKKNVPHVAYDLCLLDFVTTKHNFTQQELQKRLKPLLDTGNTSTWTMQWYESIMSECFRLCFFLFMNKGTRRWTMGQCCLFLYFYIYLFAQQFRSKRTTCVNVDGRWQWVTAMQRKNGATVGRPLQATKSCFTCSPWVESMGVEG